MKAIIRKELADLRHLDWSRVRHSSGTAGSLLKATASEGRNRYYYKLSSYDAFEGITGHECVNEIIVDRLLDLLHIPHLHYELIHGVIRIEEQEHETWLCRSRDFKKRGESKIALDVFYQMERMREESPLAFCVRQGWGEYIAQMLTVDYLILNRDRHGANMEVLRDREKQTLRLAPLFDHGLSLLCSAGSEQEAETFDVLADLPVQCFVGSRSARRNLELIPQEERKVPGILRESDRVVLFEDLESVLPPLVQDRIWEMIWKRWRICESLCNS